MASRSTLRYARQRYALAELPLKGLDMERSFAVLYRKDGYLSPIARRMIDSLEARGK